MLAARWPLVENFLKHGTGESLVLLIPRMHVLYRERVDPSVTPDLVFVNRQERSTLSFQDHQ